MIVTKNRLPNHMDFVDKLRVAMLDFTRFQQASVYIGYVSFGRDNLPQVFGERSHTIVCE